MSTYELSGCGFESSYSQLFLFVFLMLSLPTGEKAIVTSFLILIWSKGNIFSPVRYSDLSMLPDDNVDMFAATLL